MDRVVDSRQMRREDIQERLHELLKGSGESLDRLTHATGVGIHTVCPINSGSYGKQLRLDTLHKIAKGIGYIPVAIYDRRGNHGIPVLGARALVDDNYIGKVIRTTRQNIRIHGRKLSLDKLAKLVGVTRAAISLWENGVVKPSFENLDKVTYFLSLEAQFLLTPPLYGRLRQLKGENTTWHAFAQSVGVETETLLSMLPGSRTATRLQTVERIALAEGRLPVVFYSIQNGKVVLKEQALAYDRDYVATAITRTRQEMEMHREDLAHRLDRPTPSLRQVEEGERKPLIPFLERICAELQIIPAYFRKEADVEQGQYRIAA